MDTYWQTYNTHDLIIQYHNTTVSRLCNGGPVCCLVGSQHHGVDQEQDTVMLNLIRHKKGKTRKERDREKEEQVMSSRESSQERQEGERWVVSPPLCRLWSCVCVRDNTKQCKHLIVKWKCQKHTEDNRIALFHGQALRIFHLFCWTAGHLTLSNRFQSLAI